MSKWLASICETLLQSVIAGGVTLLQLLPPSRVRWISPSSVPAQMVSACKGEGPIEYTTPKRSVIGSSISFKVTASRRGGGSGWRRARSGLIFSQVLPRSRERITNWLAKYSASSACENTSGSVQVLRAGSFGSAGGICPPNEAAV